MAWFSLNPNGNPTIPNNYTLETSTPSCGGQDQICAVQATPDGSGKYPNLSNPLKDEMILALHNREESTNVKLKDA